MDREIYFIKDGTISKQEYATSAPGCYIMSKAPVQRSWYKYGNKAGKRAKVQSLNHERFQKYNKRSRKSRNILGIKRSILMQ
jgi:hypothetical protein